MALMDGDVGSPDSVGADTLAQLPEEIQEFILIEQANRQQVIDALSVAVAGARDESVKYRSASGIETEWAEDDEYYEGIDDANRGEQHMVKPNHPSGVLTNLSVAKESGKRSSIFYNITRQYVDSAAASVSEMGNPTDDRNFSLKALPAPSLEAHLDNETPVQDARDQSGQPVAATVGDFAQQEVEEANKKALRAEKRIDSWLIPCQWHAENRLAVHDAARVGSGIMKGPVPAIRTSKKTKAGQDGKTAMVVDKETVPISKRINCWNLYPAKDCGDDIQKGTHIIELDHVNARQLREMKQLSGYISTQIDKVLEEGPKHLQATSRKDENTSDAIFDIWYYYGILTRDQIRAMGIVDGMEGSEDDTDKKTMLRIEQLEACPCIVTLVNDTAIKASLNPLDSGEYPYDILKWEAREGSPWGRGISRIMRDAQRVVNAAVRNLMDNAGLSGGVQVGVKKGSIRPMNNDWKLKNVTFWELTDDDAKSIDDCLSFHQIPSLQAELMNIISFGQKMAEDVTGMPLLLQGQTGAAPDTVGGMQLLNKNATATRRMIARKVDAELTEPHIRRYYEWLLIYGEEEEKGDYNIDARGSQSLVERDIARQFAIQMVGNALQPAYGIDPYKAMSNTLRAEMIDPSTWQIDETTYKQNLAKQQQAGSQTPAVQAATIRAQSAEQINAAKIQGDQQVAQIRAQGDVQSTQLRTERDAAYEQQVENKNAADNAFKYEELKITREIALLQYANQNKMNLDKVKQELAQTTMRLQTERELAAQAAQLEQSESSDTAASNQVNQAHQQASQQAGQGHEQVLEAMRQKHERELQDLQHKHDINVANLQPEVQLPTRAGKGNSLNQMPAEKKE